MSEMKIKDFFKYAHLDEGSEIDSILPNGTLAVIPNTWLFWQEYIANTYDYDRRFYTMYKSFRPFYEIDDFILDVWGDVPRVFVELAEFQENVFALLNSNAKKYNELYRTYVVADDDYMLVDNYSIVETMDKELTNEGKLNKGSQSDTLENKVSPYDTENFYNENSATDVSGAREDTTTGSGTEKYTLTRKGNIGVQTATDMLRKHNDFWKPYEFYDMIFKDICKELLII